jgi:hypothetical protein
MPGRRLLDSVDDVMQLRGYVVTVLRMFSKVFCHRHLGNPFANIDMTALCASSGPSWLYHIRTGSHPPRSRRRVL